MTLQEKFEVRKIQGNEGSASVNIPESIRKKLNINIGDKVKIDISGRKINIEPIREGQKIRDINLNEEKDRIIIQIKNKGGDTHKLPFKKSITIHKGKEKATLQAIYEHLTSIRGYYKVGKGEEYELTLWADGQSIYSIDDFSHRRDTKSNINLNERADRLLWEK